MGLISVDMAIEASQRHAERFRRLWEAGAGLDDNPVQLIDHAARTIYFCQIVQRDGGFLVKLSASNIRKKVEKAMTEAQLLKRVAIRLRELSEA